MRVRAEDRMGSVADGVRVSRIGAGNAPILQAHLSDLISVTEAEVHDAMRSMFRFDGLMVEGAGAVAVAGLKAIRGRRRVAVVSGGNVDPAVFRMVTGPPVAEHAAGLLWGRLPA